MHTETGGWGGPGGASETDRQMDRERQREGGISGGFLGKSNLLDSGSILICGGEAPLDFNLGEDHWKGVGGNFS